MGAGPQALDRRSWRKRVALDRVAALLLAALACLLFQQLVVRLDPARTVQANLSPHPDAAEYLDGAVHLLKEGRFAIHLAGESHPPRYPYGYSLLQTAALALGYPTLQAPYLVNKLAGWALLLSIFAWTARRRSWMAGGLAALLLAVQPSMVILCRAPMSEVSAVIPVLWGILLLYGYARGGSWKAAGLGGLLLGLALHFRLSAVLMMGFVAAALWARSRRTNDFPLRGLLAIVAGLALAAAPLALFLHFTFGAPWKTGYSYWLASDGAPDQLFSLAHLWPNLHMLALEAAQWEVTAGTASSTGEGSYFGPASLILLFLGVAYQMRRREARAFALAGAAFLLGQLVYAYPLGRLYFPAVVLAIPAAAGFLTDVLPQLRQRRRHVGLVLICLLLAAALGGWPGKRSDTEIGDLWRTHPLGAFPLEYEVVTQIRLHGRAPLLALTDFNPPYLHAMLSFQQGRTDRHGPEADPWTAPLQDDHDYRYNPSRFIFAAAQRRALVEEALSQSRQVWTATSLFPIDAVDEAVPPPAGYRWRVVWRNRMQGGLAVLEPQAAQ